MRRDLGRLQDAGKLKRVRGGAHAGPHGDNAAVHLQGVPFHENVNLHRAAKEAIGKAAAGLCQPGEAVIIDGGSTTLQMCPHLEPLKLQVLTNTLHIVSALMSQPNTSISLTGGVVFREQNIVLDPFAEAPMRNFHAKWIFLSAASITRHGLMQSDIIITQAERKLLSFADHLVVLADSSKFLASAGHLLCELDRVHTLVTDSGISQTSAEMVKAVGAQLIVVEP